MKLGDADWYEPFPVFVYGTLRQGFANHQRLCFDLTEFVPAWTTGHLYDLPFGYPAMIQAEDGRVVGEILTFADNSAAIRRLDKLEGFRPEGPRHYDRIITNAHPIDGRDPVHAWCYVYQPDRLREIGDRARLIPDGNWKTCD